MPWIFTNSVKNTEFKTYSKLNELKVNMLVKRIALCGETCPPCSKEMNKIFKIKNINKDVFELESDSYLEYQMKYFEFKEPDGLDF